MKKCFFLIFLVPFFADAQVKAIKGKTVSKTAVKKPADKAVNTADGFVIKGDIEGFDDNTPVRLLNGTTGAEEQLVMLQKGKFTFNGKMTTPEFKYISIPGQERYIVLFLDNSTVTLNAKKENFENAEIKGSHSQEDFNTFSKLTKEYNDLFMGKGRFDVGFMDKAASTLEQFINDHKDSYITPLAIYQFNQITGDYTKLENMYNSLAAPVKTTSISVYVAKMIADNKQIAYGKPLGDFVQADTSGKDINLASFKGKYVLVDFWASWCGPCRAENPNVVNTFEKYKDKNFTVLGVSLDKTKDAWINAIAADGLAWTHVSDLKGWGNAVAGQFGIQSIPQNFLLDPNGILIGKNLRGAALEYRLSKVLK